MNWQKLQAIDKRILYVILLVLGTAGLFIQTEIPTDPDPSSKALYRFIMNLDPEKPVIIQSDWTNGTRGESMGHMENVYRMLMSRNIKFVVYSAGDPIAPQVARTVLSRINDEREKAGLRRYRLGEDYLELGFFANSEGTNVAMGQNLRSFWNNRRTKVEGGGEVSIWETPVLRNVNRIEDCGMMIVITASATIDIAVQRLSQRVPIGTLVTGVVGPTVLPFFQSKQVVGIAVGLKGVYDMEYMMRYGINNRDETKGRVMVTDPTSDDPVTPVSEGRTFARGAQYYGTLHVVLALLIGSVILGNVAMFAARRQQGGNAS